MKIKDIILQNTIFSNVFATFSRIKSIYIYNRKNINYYFSLKTNRLSGIQTLSLSKGSQSLFDKNKKI